MVPQVMHATRSRGAYILGVQCAPMFVDVALQHPPMFVIDQLYSAAVMHVIDPWHYM